jgi:hypothetical protein
MDFNCKKQSIILIYTVKLTYAKLSADSNYLVLAQENGNVLIYDINLHKIIKTFSSIHNGIFCYYYIEI